MRIISFIVLFIGLQVFAQSSNQILVLSAIVKDKTISGAEVIFQKNGQQSTPKITNSQGLVNIPADYADDSNVIIIIKKAGYSTLVSKCRCGGLTYAISPIMEALDDLRIVLTWGKNPLDLDSHLSYADGYVCYHKKEARNANLDVDDVDSYGPETITILKKRQGQKYVYAVHNFSDKDISNNANLSKSNARVHVYIGTTLIKTYYVPSNKNGTVWIPFLIDENGNIVDISDFKNANSWEAVKAILKNYRPNERDIVISSGAAESSKTLNKKGEDAYHAKNLELSVEYYLQAIEQNPNFGQAYSNLGLSFQKLGREAEALWANRKAIDLASGPKANTTKANSYYNIGKIYEEKSQWQDALDNYKAAKRNNPKPIYDTSIDRVSAKL
jgi:tetratricopeptide (TPR) repeat protein